MAARSSRPKVLYWGTSPAPYFLERLAAVNRTGQIEVLSICASVIPARAEWISPNEDQLRVDFVLDQQVPMWDRQFAKLLRTEQPDLLVSLYGTRQFIIGSLLAQVQGIRTAYRVLPTYETWFPRTKTREFAKKALFQRVDSAKVHGEEGAAYAKRYGLPDDRIFPVTQSIDVAHYAAAQGMQSDVRQQRREALEWRGFTYIYVGRLTKLKGVDFLLSAFEEMNAAGTVATLVLVGAGPDEAEYRTKAAAIPNIKFVGFRRPADLPQLYALADAMVFPTLGDPNGLVVEEAMAAGLPVISSASAGNIRSRLGEGAAGIVVPPSDSIALAEAMKTLIRNQDLARSMGAHGADLVKTRDHEHYAEDFVRFVDGTLRLPARISPTRTFDQMFGALGRLRRPGGAA